MEPECKIEKSNLIKLIRSFKILLKQMISEYNIDLNKNENYLSLKSFYEEVETKLLDSDYFHCLLGKTFDDKCNPIVDEYIEDEE
jgi:hypothetical protein